VIPAPTLYSHVPLAAPFTALHFPARLCATIAMELWVDTIELVASWFDTKILQLLNANCVTRKGLSVTVFAPVERKELVMFAQSNWFGPVKGVPEQVVVQAASEMDMGAAANAATVTSLLSAAEELAGRGARKVVTKISGRPGMGIRDVEPMAAPDTPKRQLKKSITQTGPTTPQIAPLESTILK